MALAASSSRRLAPAGVVWLLALVPLLLQLASLGHALAGEREPRHHACEARSELDEPHEWPDHDAGSCSTCQLAASHEVAPPEAPAPAAAGDVVQPLARRSDAPRVVAAVPSPRRSRAPPAA